MYFILLSFFPVRHSTFQEGITIYNLLSIFLSWLYQSFSIIFHLCLHDRTALSANCMIAISSILMEDCLELLVHLSISSLALAPWDICGVRWTECYLSGLIPLHLKPGGPGFESWVVYSQDFSQVIVYSWDSFLFSKIKKERLCGMQGLGIWLSQHSLTTDLDNLRLDITLGIFEWAES